MIPWIKKAHRDFLAIIFLITTSSIGLYELVTNSFYTSHDGYTHTARIAAYFQALFVDGQVLPEWANQFNNGAGSPIFVYIYPIPYLLGSLIHTLGFDFQTCFRIVMALGSIFGMTLFYIWLRGHFSKLAAIFGALLYFFVPYRFLNTYVRGAFAENLAYGFIPLAFLLVDVVSLKRKAYYIIMLAGSITLILLSHNEVSAIFLPIIFLYALGKSVKSKTLNPLGNLLMGAVLAFLVSAFIYIPDLFERGYIHFDRGISYYQDHFVSLWQLLRSPWGYGFDFPGYINDAMSFQIGLGHIAVITMTAAVFAYKAIRDGKTTFLRKNIEVIVFLFVIAISLTLMFDTPIAAFFWEKVPLVETILDFPWRLLGVVMVGSSFLGAFLVDHIPYKKVVVLMGILALVFLNRNHWRINQAQSFTDREFQSFQGSGTATSNEFSPARHATAKIIEAGEVITPLSFLGSYKILQNNAIGIVAQLESTTGGTIRVNRFYFPDTVITRNGERLVENKNWSILGYEPDKVDEWHDDSGFLKVDILPGETNLVVKLEKTPLRKTASRLSLVATISIFMVITATLCQSWLKKRRKFSKIAGKL